MATTQNKFEGWSYSFDGEDSNTGRRSRKRGDTSLILTREEDGLEVKSGSLLLCNNTDEEDGPPIVVLIKEAQVGNANFMDLIGINLLRGTEVQNKPPNSHKNELFLTSVEDKIYVSNIIEEVQVYNEAEFKNVTIDRSNDQTTFLCRKGYDTYFGSYSNVFDFKKIRESFVKDPSSAMENLRNITVKQIYKEKLPPPTTVKKEKPAKQGSNKVTAPAKKPKINNRSQTRSKQAASKKRTLKEHIISDDDDADEFDDALDDLPSSDGSTLEEGTDLTDDESENDSDDERVPDDDEFGVPKTKKKIQKYNKKRKIRGPRSLAISKELPKKLIESIEQLSESAQETVARLPRREEQFSDLYSNLESNIELEQGASYYISGPPGTGKTVTIREVVKQLFRATRESNLNSFDYVEINGMKLLNPQAAYELLWKKVSNGQNVPATGLSIALEDYFKNGQSEIPIVVLLDELDSIASKNQSILYNFFNWPTYDKSKLVVIAVANTMDLPERILSNKTSSRLGDSRVQFPGYTHEDLISIIKSKLELLVEEGVSIKDDSIEFASRKVASVSGDARRALKIVKRAAQLAKESTDANTAVQVQPVHINRAINESTNSPVASYITSLSFVGKLILVGIYSRKSKSGLAENSLGDVIDEIKQIVSINKSNNGSQSTINGETFLEILYNDYVIRPDGFQYALHELVEAGIVLLSNVKSERNSLIKLNIADEEVTSVFKRDKSLKFFADLTSTKK